MIDSESGVLRLVTSGVINPHQLVDPKRFCSVHDIITGGFSSGQTGEGGLDKLDRVYRGVVNIVFIASHCGLLESDLVQTLSLVLDQMNKFFSISTDEQVFIDNMCKRLKVPKSLQQLSRNEVLRNVNTMPRVSIPKLELPKKIQGYLLYDDIDADVIIKSLYDHHWLQ